MYDNISNYPELIRKYNVIRDRWPEVGDLVYVSYIGIFRVEKTDEDRNVNVKYNGATMRFGPNHYRLVERKLTVV